EGSTYYFVITQIADNVDNVSNSVFASDGFTYDTGPPVVRITERNTPAVELPHTTIFKDYNVATGPGNDEILSFTYEDATSGTITLEYYVDNDDNCLADDSNSW